MTKGIFTKEIILLIFVLVFAWFFFNFRITQTPPGINGDEAAIGYNAALVAKTGFDQNNRFIPLFVSVFDSSDYKQPVTFYATVAAFKIFGSSFTMLREVSIFFVLISALLTFLLVREILGVRAAVVSLFVFLTIPAVLIQSHLALENIAPVPFSIVWFWMMCKYQKSFKHKYLYLAGIFLGTGLFSYAGMRLIVPVYVMLTAGFIYYLNKNKSLKVIIGEVFRFTLPVLFFVLILYLSKYQYPGAILRYNRLQGIPAYQEFILPYVSSFDPSFLFVQGDSTPYHSTGKQGVFLLATLPLFVLGLFQVARKKNPILLFALLTFFLTPLLFGLPASIHRGSRLLVLLPSFAIIATLGFLALLNLRQKYLKIILVSIVVLTISANYVDFVRDYWYEYPQRVKSEFSKPFNLVFERAKQLSVQHNLSPMLQNDFRVQNPIAVDFFEITYFPNKLKVWNTGQTLPKSSLAIVNYSDDFKAIPSEKIEGTNFGILINY